MYWLKLSLSILFISACSMLKSQDLSTHRWQHRLVILLTSDTTQSAFQAQVKELSNYAQGLGERKIIIYQALPKAYRKGLDSSANWSQSDEIFTSLKKTDAPFEILLIGLDGGVKLRKDEFVPCRELFTLIDGMPMRRAEMRRQQKP